MVSRANLSGRPGMGGILNRVMNPMQKRASSVREKIAPAAEAVAATPEIAAQQGGGGFSGMVGRALSTAKAKQAEMANQAVEPQAPPQSPVGGMVARNQARAAKKQRALRRPRAGLEQVGVSQEELAGTAQPLSRKASLEGRMARAQGTLADEAAEAEVGGTRTETPVTEPSLNQSRRNRSRSGRMYRR